MRHRPIALIPQHFGCLLFDRNTGRYFPFDRESTAVLQELAKRPLADVFGHLEREQEEILSGFLASAWKRGWLTPQGVFDASWLDLEPPPNHLAGPLAVHLEVSDRCNLTCKHCFAAPLPRGETSLGLDQLDGLFRELASMGSFRLGLTGGEPLLRPEIFEIIDAATERGLLPCLTTNGLLLDEHVVSNLARRKLGWLNVSLDGATEATNDEVRGKGTYQAVLASVRRLRGRVPFSLCFTITNASSAEVQSCALLAKEVGAKAAVFRPVYPVGRAREQATMIPSYLVYRRCMEVLDDVKGRFPTLANLDVVDAFGPLHRRKIDARVAGSNQCGAGTLVASVSIGGAVSPCSFLGRDSISGWLFESSFSDLWHHGATFRRLRASQGRFQGGCRARALAYEGDAEGVDPWQTAWAEKEGIRA